MNNKCPTCGASYNITPQHVGRSFTCQRCQTALVVQPEGLTVAGGSAQPSAPPAPGQEAFAGMDVGGGAGGFPAPPALPPAPGGYAPSGPAGPNAIVDYLMFKQMSPPILLVVLFWVGLAYILIDGLNRLVFAIQSMSGSMLVAFPGAGVFGLFTSLLYLVTFPIFWRLLIETFAAVARMNSKS